MKNNDHTMELEKQLPVRPNVFSFATSELSQDAIFAWLIQWADPQYKELDISLNHIAQNFLRLLMAKNLNYQIYSVTVGRQWKRIDVWVEINNDAFLAIEDKTFTGTNDEQLDKYRSIVNEKYCGERTDIMFSYVKIGNESKSSLDSIERKGYKVIERKDIVDCLKKYSGNNELIKDYLAHLNDIEIKTNEWRKAPLSVWKNNFYAWQGFYRELETRLRICDWNYVPNPSSGFWGAWWNFVEINDIQMYLQFEESKLCFKICYEGDGDKSSIRNKYHTIIMKNATNRYPEIQKPARLGYGTCMTIAIVSSESIFGSGIVNMESIVKKLKNYQELINECCK